MYPLNTTTNLFRKNFPLSNHLSYSMGENLQKCVLRAEHHTSGSAKEEFVVFVNPNTVEQWRKDSTKVLLNDVVPAYEIFCHVGGDHGVLGRPSNQQLRCVLTTMQILKSKSATL